ncbi:MAG: ATP-binding protein [Odoribacter sp.]
MAKALTYKNIEDYKPVELAFSGRWEASFGCPEVKGSWLIWGNSGSGKTRFTLQLCKYLCQFGKVIYNSLEEGLSKSMQNAIIQVGMKEAGRRFIFLDMESMGDLEKRLEKRKSPDVIIIDSLQYFRMTQKDYDRFKKKFPNKLFVFISHAKGSEPKGAVAESIRYDAFVKVWIEGYKALPVSRYVKNGESENFTIWAQGAEEYWGNKINKKTL